MYMRVHVKFNQSVVHEYVLMCLMLEIEPSYLPRIKSDVTLLHSEILFFFSPLFFHHRDKGGCVSYYRVATAPCIPVPGQNHGYEEGEERVLKLQLLPPLERAYYDVTHV